MDGHVHARHGAAVAQRVAPRDGALVGAGLVRRIGRVVCRGCGALDDVDCVSGEAPCLGPPTDKGFVVDEAEVTFWGTCRSCSGTTVGGGQSPSTTKENI